jgi:hypothetical protein
VVKKETDMAVKSVGKKRPLYDILNERWENRNKEEMKKRYELIEKQSR